MKRLTADQERIEEAVLWVSILRPGEEDGMARDGSGGGQQTKSRRRMSLTRAKRMEGSLVGNVA